ncbi:MAG TPA: FkbM family methyltransferase [Lacipirellula sp.]
MLRRRPRVPFAQWGHDIREFCLPTDGVVRFAQWRHPRVSQQLITQEEVDGLRQFIRPGDFAIDVGAHSGDTSVPMALAAGESGCVLALEPNPHVFKVLEVNAALNPAAARIIPECIAATEEDGAYVFHYGDASFCNGGLPGRWRRNPLRRRYPLSVVGRNLLRLLRTEYAELLPRLSYVKVDAEGYDRVILKSILPILREHQPVVRTEVFRKLKGYDRHVLYELLTGNGYEVFRYEPGANPRGPRLRREQMTAQKHFDILAISKR